MMSWTEMVPGVTTFCFGAPPGEDNDVDVGAGVGAAAIPGAGIGGVLPVPAFLKNGKDGKVGITF